MFKNKLDELEVKLWLKVFFVRFFHCSFVSRHFFVANIFNELSQYNQMRRFIDIITFISATKK